MTDQTCDCRQWDPKLPGCAEGRDRDIMGNPLELTDCLYFQPLTCRVCGLTGPEVTVIYEHIGGQGNPQPISLCLNALSCWQRWERNQLAQIRR